MKRNSQTEALHEDDIATLANILQWHWCYCIESIELILTHIQTIRFLYSMPAIRAIMSVKMHEKNM